MRCLFVSDLHGRVEHYRKLFAAIREQQPEAVLLGGDLLPFPLCQAKAAGQSGPDFVADFLAVECSRLRADLGPAYPQLLLILGNDDPRLAETSVLAGQVQGLWAYLHRRRILIDDLGWYGYSCVPPTPFLLKDWERYDVSRFVDPGCVPPEEGQLTVRVSADELAFGTIQQDLERLVGNDELARSAFLFHSPPYHTVLDRAALDGHMVDHVPLDVHVGSIAIRRLIEQRQPLVTLHGHVHESTRLTGCWRDRIGRTHAFQAAHDGPELSLVRFDTDDLGAASRDLL